MKIYEIYDSKGERYWDHIDEELLPDLIRDAKEQYPNVKFIVTPMKNCPTCGHLMSAKEVKA